MSRLRFKRNILILSIIFFMKLKEVLLADASTFPLPMGSILFDDHGSPKKCFVQNDIALLSTRLKFQALLPKGYELSMVNDEKITAFIKYFHGINEIIEKSSQDEIRQLVQKSFYDLLGSYLHHQVLPVSKFSFYSGHVTFSAIQDLFNLFERCKELLDTNGNGWSDPITDFSSFKIKIEPLNFKKLPSDDDSVKACANLALNQNDEDNEEDMLVSLPKIEVGEGEELSTIWLPLKRKHIFNINARTSTFIIFRYFVLVSQCYSYQGVNQAIFNQRFKTWLIENVMPYLDDEKLYPAFGGLLRIYETIKGSDDRSLQVSKVKFSRRFKDSYIGFSIEDSGDVLDLESHETDIERYLHLALAASVALLVTILILCCLYRICRNQKVVRDQDGKNSQSLRHRVTKFFARNTHRPERDEFYQYRKAPGRDVTFENEKANKLSFLKKKSKYKEKFELPLLGNATDSEDDVVLHQIDPKKKSKFKISESSEDEEKKPSKSSLKSPKASSHQAGLFSRIRSLSPKRREKPRDDRKGDYKGFDVVGSEH